MKTIKCRCKIEGKTYIGELSWENKDKFAMLIGKFKIEMHFPKKTYTYTVLEDK